jgi:hypothetical protein
MALGVSFFCRGASPLVDDFYGNFAFCVARDTSF